MEALELAKKRKLKNVGRFNGNDDDVFPAELIAELVVGHAGGVVCGKEIFNRGIHAKGWEPRRQSDRHGEAQGDGDSRASGYRSGKVFQSNFDLLSHQIVPLAVPARQL